MIESCFGGSFYLHSYHCGDILNSVSMEAIVLKKIITLYHGSENIIEMPTFGKNRLQGQTAGAYNYAELLKDIQTVFAQDDLFDSVEVIDVSLKDSDMTVTCRVKTKYSYSVVKTFTL